MSNVYNLAIIQARMGSSRLPNKVLMNLQGKFVLEHVADRVGKSKLIDKIVVATTTHEIDDKIVSFCETHNIEVFRGSENDVLDRYYQCAKQFEPENIIRITADCPLIDPRVIDLVIKEHLQNANDYTSNTIIPTYPDGEDVEIMKFSILEDAWLHAELASQREHVTQYIIHSDSYKKSNVVNSENLESLRWTLDTADDYEFIEKIYNKLYPKDPFFGMETILELLKEQPDLVDINSKYGRNEGLAKSLDNDYLIREKV